LSKPEKSPFESADMLKITVVGRKTGNNITVPVQFVFEKDKILLLPFMGKRTNWYSNLTKNPTITITIKKMKIQGNAILSTDEPLLRNVIEKFVAKYGRTNIATYYPKKDAFVEVKV
jgi:deazaflavin-dependent oxidoreductase (nitroreductase family)